MPERDPPAAKPARQRPRDPPATVIAPALTRGICVVGIGASSGGLEACKRFLAAMPAEPGMAFILVQHMDPTRESLLVALLRDATPMPVLQATDGMLLEPNHFYVIPPSEYLSVGAGALRLSAPNERRGARLPFDFLLHTLATAAGPRAICVILSGSGADGSAGLKAIKAAGGLVIAQAPDEAGYDGMPRNAIAGGGVDLVLPAEKIAEALVRYRKTLDAPQSQTDLARIIALLRLKTPHDFTLYKPGTLLRRIARRMAMAGLAAHDMAGYLDILQNDTAERDNLAADLLINVTSFFRDPKAFEALAATVIPELAGAAADRPIRIWVTGCSTGEETYSLAMLFQEMLTASGSDVKLQIFASDVDAQAVATAREGLYPRTIENNVSPERLARFFTKEDSGYRISPGVRSKIVFAVQDVLADPPFSKLDFISCRNLLIYLRPEAQTKIISIFNFALRKSGFLLLGSAETVGALDGRFAVISKPARLYRKTSPGRAEDLQFTVSAADMARAPLRTGILRPAARAVDIAELCKRLVLAAYAPAAILINQNYICQYSSGPTDRYLRVAPGYPTHDLLSQLPPAMRSRVKAAISQADATNSRIVVAGCRVFRDGRNLNFNIDVQPVMNDEEKLLLICFVDQPDVAPEKRRRVSKIPQNALQMAALEQELATARAELEAALHSLEVATQDQNAVNEEALSINEEYQSTNEELLTSKEELQSLNEELTALNSQLQETLERSRMTTNDLQNVLYSTAVATLFLDAELKIRFFTPTIRALFTIIQSDLGRPLSDLHALATDPELHDDAKAVLQHFVPIEREVQTPNGAWFNRRILPYRTHENGVAGVVIIFMDITERKMITAALESSQREAERANLAKSNFLAAASHDLRQPLQTLTLLNGLMAKAVEGTAAQPLLEKLDDTTNAMTGILNTLLDINQIDAGVVRINITSVPIADLMRKLGEEFSYLAQARGLTLHVVPCSLNIHTDPRILEQMLRNLLSNAFKYTLKGGVLLGCRRRGKQLSIEICDTGLGIPATELAPIFEEYHQVNNAAREGSRGMGLGLSIVQRLGNLLHHRVGVRSVYGKGSIFSIEVSISEVPATDIPVPVAVKWRGGGVPQRRTGKILVVEDDADIRQLLEMFLREQGHDVAVAHDGNAAISLVGSGAVDPDVILADYNLPNGANGLEVIAKLRSMLGHEVKVIIVTGDISTETIRNVAKTKCIQMNKPMRLLELNEAIQHMLTPAGASANAGQPAGKIPLPLHETTVIVVDDDIAIRQSLRIMFEQDCRSVRTFADSEAFLAAEPAHENACVLIDAGLPGMSGLELLRKLSQSQPHLPAIMITGHGDIKMAVEAMRAGALDFIEKPASHDRLRAAVSRAFEHAQARLPA